MKINTSINTEDSLYHDAQARAGVSNTSSTGFTTEFFIRSANKYYNRVNGWIWQATPDWEYDDSNKSDLPIAKADLVDGQQNYELPSTAQRVLRMEVKDDSGDWHTVEAFDESQIPDEALLEFYETDGLPKFYRLAGRSIFLYPAPSSDDVTTSSGLRLHFARTVTEFSLTDTSTEPGFDPQFHSIISAGPAYDFMVSKGYSQDLKEDLRTELAELRQSIYKFYSARHRNFKRRIIPSKGNLEEYI